MARVKVINGKPVIFNKLPEVWQGINGHYLNFDKEVVGITKFCIHPDEWFNTKTRIGGTKSLNIEKI